MDIQKKIIGQLEDLEYFLKTATPQIGFLKSHWVTALQKVSAYSSTMKSAISFKEFLEISQNKSSKIDPTKKIEQENQTDLLSIVSASFSSIKTNWLRSGS